MDFSISYQLSFGANFNAVKFGTKSGIGNGGNIFTTKSVTPTTAGKIHYIL